MKVNIAWNSILDLQHGLVSNSHSINHINIDKIIERKKFLIMLSNEYVAFCVRAPSLV